MIHWKFLNTDEDIQSMIECSASTPCGIFKHSTRCNLSAMAKYQLESDWDFEAAELHMYIVDVIQQKDISAAITDVFSEYHESPQLLLIRDGECTYAAAQLDITVEELRECYFD